MTNQFKTPGFSKSLNEFQCLKPTYSEKGQNSFIDLEKLGVKTVNILPRILL